MIFSAQKLTNPSFSYIINNMRDKRTLIVTLLLLTVSFSTIAANQLSFKITGITGKPLDNVKQSLDADAKTYSKNLSYNNMQRIMQLVPNTVKQALGPYGFFKPSSSSRLSGGAGGKYVATVNINPGPAMKLTRLDLNITGEGASTKPFKRFYKRFPVKVGQNFNAEKYDNAKQALFTRARNLGYFKARLIKSQAIINLQNYQASEVIRFDTGPRYRFGIVKFSKTPFNRSFLERYIHFHEGQPYNNRLVQQLQKDLSNASYFASVTVAPETDKLTHDEVPIKVTLVMRKKRQYTVGAGYGTDTQFRGSVTYQQRYVGHKGHFYSAQIQASQISDLAIVKYNIPGGNPAKNLWTATGGFQHIDSKNLVGDGGTYAQSTSGKAALSYATHIWGWQQTVALTYLTDRYKIFIKPNKIPETDQNQHLLMPTLRWQKTRSNKKSKPTRGYNITVNASGGSDSVGSSINFLQFRINANSLFTFHKNYRLLLTGVYGHTFISNILNLPYTQQFYLGGSAALRGFDYNSIGPGKNEYLGSFELQRRVYKDFYLAGFYDIGTVDNGSIYNVIKKRGLNGFYQSAGPGIMWLTSIGALEVDYAYPIHNPNPPKKYKPSWKFEFNIDALI